MENLHAVSHIIQHKTFSALNYAQDFGNRVMESLKRTTNSNGLHSRKVELFHVKYFHAFVSTLNYVSTISENNDKRRWSWDGGGLDRELSTCLPTNYKKRINSRKSGIFTTSITGLCHVICYLFKTLKPFLHQLNSKNNGLVLLFKTILALIPFPVICCNGLQGLKMDWNLGQRQDTEHMQ